MNQPELFKTAVQKAKAGERSQARDMLHQLVQNNPQHELAWLWLSELVEDPEDKFIALENALTINPNRSQTHIRLRKLHQKYPTLAPTQANPPDLFVEDDANELAHIQHQLLQGDVAEGRQQLATYLHTHTDHAAAWWLMVQHADSQKNQLLALDHLLRLNPQHAEAVAEVNSIKPTREEALQMGRIYERLDDWKTAVYHYKRALRSSQKKKAQQRLAYAEEQLFLANIKTTHPTTTVLRLAAGPTLLYTLLLIIQAGFSPMQFSPLLCLGNTLFFAGLLLRGGLAHTPNHHWLERLRETAIFHHNLILPSLSRTLIALPIFLVILLSLSRLLAFLQEVQQP